MLWLRPRALPALLRRFGLRSIDSRISLFWPVTLGIVIVAAVFRLAWVEDMEYKGDESWTYLQTRIVRDGGPLPLIGMPTSQNAPNPAGSIWVFVGLSELFRPDSPTELARIGHWMNILAIAGLLVFASVCVPADTRAAWVWAAALVAVNPLAVVLHRKIWPPSIAPILLLGVLIGWWHRDRRWGAAMWGFLGVVIGQIHLSGMFLAAGMAAWAGLFDRRGVRWWAWAVGVACAAWPLALWLPTAVEQAAANPTGQIRLSNFATLNFFLRWVTEPFGIVLSYSLGNDFGDFLRYPIVSGTPTYLVGGLHVAIYSLLGYFVVSTLIRAWQQRREWRQILTGSGSASLFMVNAVALGYGGLLTLSCVPIHRHYMLVTFPAMQLWVAILALSNRRPFAFGLTRGQALLLTLCLVQSAVSACFLGYVHENQRAIRGDYGMPYAAQIRCGVTPK